MNSLLLKPGSLVLFQGDSITDAGRSREDDNILGYGYPNFVTAWLWASYPELNLRFVNRGISGNRVVDLEGRWTRDCVDLKPDWVSIMIGINDTWRRYDSNVVSPISDFDSCYRRILDRVKSETEAGLIILEPFVLHTPGRKEWREDLDPRIDAVKKIAADYSAIYISLDEIFTQACKNQGPAFWAADGVHPTQAGHALIAQSWIKAVGG